MLRSGNPALTHNTFDPLKLTASSNHVMTLDGAVNKLKKNNIKNYKIIKVPGTLEIPTVVATLINKYKGFIVLGCVIKGQTPHFNYLCNSVFTSLINLSASRVRSISG